MQALAIQNSEPEPPVSVGYVGKIPVRNLWLLMLYASDLFRQLGTSKIAVEDNPDDIADLVAEILSRIVERRLMRNLSHGYRRREAVVNRVRGRIDLFKTERQQLLERGKVACRFDELTVNTPRNRFVRAALERLAGIVRSKALSHRCRVVVATLFRMGVVGEKPTSGELAGDRFGRHDVQDMLMVHAAKLGFDLSLPTEESGDESLLNPDREERWVRRLFEKAVAGFYDVVLTPGGWRVDAGKHLDWQTSKHSEGVAAILPGMRSDIILEHPGDAKRLIIDTKFTSITKKGQFKQESLKSGYLYQIYAYVRSQERLDDPLSLTASGLLLHPSIGESVDEFVSIQGHRFRFATVDLGAAASEIRRQLLQVVGEMDSQN
ncbi:MAG: 5-methylcytosine-specific restriction endonuclease system specificity protein McrC [Phycisphaerales bacterium]|nr:5-methylcytosine-specific restriction endonuclease system specificity protein McrC [Phycisphaerales bacterium]MCB9864864.1 5-methylcytosine-specific restriction endonuclease system specificity protein McrC [Phycisphaerales bacterium]